MYKILFVCTGATCRSPMASAIFNHKVRQYNISGLKSSFCGLSVQYGSEINAKGKAALKSIGIKRVCGKPEQISGKHLVENNLIVCMTEDQKQALQISVAEKYLPKIVCVKDFCGADITDPYGYDQSTYDMCRHQIEEAVEKIIGVLLGNGVAKQKKSV